MNGRGIERESERKKIERGREDFTPEIESTIFGKSSNWGNKAQRKVDHKNYDAQLSAEIIRRNYDQKLLHEIMA